MDRFLVTGAMGFIGSHWCDHLLRQGKTVYGLDLYPYHKDLLRYDNFVFVQDTIKNYPLLRTLVGRVDCVCHFAGIAKPQEYTEFTRKVIDVTAVAAIELVEICRMAGRLFFYTSTSEIYGKNTAIPFKETDDRVLGATTTRRWCYATSKALIEHMLDACAASRELDYLTVRLFNVYGPRLRGRVVSSFVERAVAGQPLEVHGDGRQSRAFTYIDDCIRAFALLLDRPACRNQVFNIGTSVETTVAELAEATRRVANSPSEIRFIPHESFYGDSYEDIGRRVPDTAKLRAATGWEPSIGLDEGLARMIDYVRAERAAE